MSTTAESVTTGAWINVEDELPPPGVKVRVDGDYIAPGSGHPLAFRCNCGFHKGEHWESNQWRGMVAIRRWWKEETTT